MNTIDTRNPKDLIGRRKIPMHLWPMSATIYGVMGLLSGMHKYGRVNWRATPVYASVYFDALLRHAYAWWEGEDRDPDDNTPHLGNCLACLAIIIDAYCCGTLVDDRQFNGFSFRNSINEFTPLVSELESKYEHLKGSVKQYTIADNALALAPATTSNPSVAGLNAMGYNPTAMPSDASEAQS
jgi:hypothetical protein